MIIFIFPLNDNIPVLFSYNNINIIEINIVMNMTFLVYNLFMSVLVFNIV